MGLLSLPVRCRSIVDHFRRNPVAVSRQNKWDESDSGWVGRARDRRIDFHLAWNTFNQAPDVPTDRVGTSGGWSGCSWCHFEGPRRAGIGVGDCLRSASAGLDREARMVKLAQSPSGPHGVHSSGSQTSPVGAPERFPVGARARGIGSRSNVDAVLDEPGWELSSLDGFV